MILIFDLDDTLYEELQFVRSGLRAVARFGECRFGLDRLSSETFLAASLARCGREKIFDRWLRNNDAWSIGRVKACVDVYRHHSPNLTLFCGAGSILDTLTRQTNLYVVTDGHKVVQRNKIRALNLHRWFRKCLVTHHYGVRYAKPSTHCFDLIRQAEGAKWSELVYIGDNPEKDFVGLNALGAVTIRVRTGPHSFDVARHNHDALLSIPSLRELPELINTL